jgi:hypothetical protein
MIEILVMLFGILPWFYRTAKRQGRSSIGWVIIGALSYYIPVAIVGRLIMPALLKGEVTTDNLVAMMILSVVLSVGAGIGCCLLARRVLLSEVPTDSLANSTSDDPTDSSTK